MVEEGHPGEGNPPLYGEKTRHYLQKLRTQHKSQLLWQDLLVHLHIMNKKNTDLTNVMNIF